MKTLRTAQFDYSRCMAILDRIDAAADLMNDDWEAAQMLYLIAASIRFWNINDRLFNTDDGGIGGDSVAGTIANWILWASNAFSICNLVLSPALVTAACDNVTNELMSMQMEASQDPKRKEESMEIGALIHYYERKSPVSVLNFTAASSAKLRLAMYLHSVGSRTLTCAAACVRVLSAHVM
eukprot:COSAG06_NODE_3280_length_5563_cov_3.516837_4_plen_181_part_00